LAGAVTGIPKPVTGRPSAPTSTGSGAGEATGGAARTGTPKPVTGRPSAPTSIGTVVVAGTVGSEESETAKKTIHTTQAARNKKRTVGQRLNTWDGVSRPRHRDCRSPLCALQPEGNEPPDRPDREGKVRLAAPPLVDGPQLRLAVANGIRWSTGSLRIHHVYSASALGAHRRSSCRGIRRWSRRR
jgi:hypothetical protein